MIDPHRIIRLAETSTVIHLLERGNLFLGLGHVEVDGVELRSPRRPMFVEIRNPGGTELVDFHLVDVRESDEEAVLKFSAYRRDGGMMEWMLHEVRNRYNTSDWSQPPRLAEDTQLELVLTPVKKSFRGEVYKGFSYQYRYSSKSIPIYKILDRGTWEVGGQIEGNSFWLRNGTIDSVYEFDAKLDPYSTEWYLPPISQPNIFQFFPLQTQMQGFTMTSHREGILLTRPREVAHVRSLFEREFGGKELAHWHEHCGDLSHEFSTSPVEVLFCKANHAQDRVSLLNSWEAIREETWASLHLQAGLKQDHVTTYAVIEEWGIPNFEKYSEKALPKILEAGFKTIMLPSEFNNNMNTWGVSNMCCQVDLKVADAIGPEKFAAFCQAAKTGGVAIELWGNTALSTLTYIFDMHDGHTSRINFLPSEGSAMETLKHSRAPWVRNPSGAVEADHYTPVFCAMNLRDPVVRSYWNTSWKHVYDNFGVQGIFIDSSFNMSSDKFHWVQNDEFDRPGGATIDQTASLGHTRPAVPPRQAIQSQYHAYLELLADMQKMGYAICGEDVGVFGTSRSGPDVRVRMRSLPLWLNSYCVFNAHAIREVGEDPDDVFFKGLAYRLVWYVYWDVEREVLSFRQSGGSASQDPTPWHYQIIKAFNLVEGCRSNRIILAGEKGVVYDGPGGSALWSFQDFEYPLAAGSIANDLISEAQHHGNRLSAKKNHVYLITCE